MRSLCKLEIYQSSVLTTRQQEQRPATLSRWMDQIEMVSKWGNAIKKDDEAGEIKDTSGIKEMDRVGWGLWACVQECGLGDNLH